MIYWNVEALRRWHCYTRAGLARKCGIPYAQMLKMCANTCTCIKLEYLDALCKQLECQVTDILILDHCTHKPKPPCRCSLTARFLHAAKQMG